MGLLDKLFGKSKETADVPEDVLDLLEETLEGIINRANLELSYEVMTNEKGNIKVELFGDDEEALLDRDGQLLDAFQLFLKRCLQHQRSDENYYIHCDSNGYREEASKELIQLADKLKKIVIEKNKSVYFRALPPKDRKTIHQHLADDGRVKSKSVGEGHYKKIKIFPISGKAGGEHKSKSGGNRNRNRDRNRSGKKGSDNKVNDSRGNEKSGAEAQ